jgi:hypothetical protein
MARGSHPRSSRRHSVLCLFKHAHAGLRSGVGKIFQLGKLPVNTQIGAYYNVVHPDDGANWQLRAQVQFMFPK